MNGWYNAVHLCLQPRQLFPQLGLCRRIKRDVIGIRFLYLRPAVNAIPLVVSQVDVEDGSLRVNGAWVGDCKPP